MRTFLRPLAAILVAVLLSACGDSDGALGNRAATVNGTDISRDLVERIVTTQLSGEGAPTGDELAAATEEVQRNVLSTLIAIEIVADLAESEGIELSEDELDEAFEEQVELYEQQAEQSGQDPEFSSFLETIGLTEDEYRDLIVADAARREALSAEYAEEVSDEDVRAVYDETAEPQIDARHILVETEAEAQDAIERIEGGDDFADVAADVSTDGSAQDGGNLGVAPASRYVPEFADAISNGEVGELLGPVETQFGFHVIEVLDVQDAPSFEDSEAQIRAQLEQANQQDPELLALYEQAFADADVTIASGLGEWDPTQGRVVDPEGDVGEGSDAPPEGEVPGDAPAEGEVPAEGDAPADDAEVDPAEEPAADTETAEQ